jgi:OmpA-OmpF porin, OOP family
MFKKMVGFLLIVLLTIPMSQALAAGDPQDFKGSKDPALFSRMPGFHIFNYEELDFDQYKFPVGPDQFQDVEGRHLYLDYYANDGITLPSALQIARNYTNAIKAIGGETVYQFEDGGMEYVTMKVAKDKTEIWAALSAAGNGMYKLHIIEKQEMKQDVAANAESLAGSIRTTGKAAVYGIYFDTDKSEIKPESEPAINEIAKLLKSDTDLKLYVVGHTDNAGTFDYNIRLSKSRADAVVITLTGKHSISASRLIPFGAGPTAPVASNASEEGRAKNRRVELVAQ